MKLCTLIFALVFLIAEPHTNAQNLRPGKIRKLIKKSEILNKHFTGFMLYDLSTRKTIAEQLSHKYFTPASNTKLFTFYSGLKILKDSVAGLQYVVKGDSLIFWSTADPTFLHPDFAGQKVKDFLLASGKKLYWAKGRYKGEFYGTGWSYDDYNEYYQPEISELPVFGNILRIKANGNILLSSPPLPLTGIFTILQDSLKPGEKFRVRREISNNTFHFPARDSDASYSQEIPFKTDEKTIDTLLKVVFPNYQGTTTMEKPELTQTIYSSLSDSVFKHMLLPSDNFMAEQLLLNYSAAAGLTMSTDSVIKYMLQNHLTDLPDKPQWVDGSGLSRQNLFSPADLVKLCEKIYDEVGDEKRLFALLPNGGRSGTLKKAFKADIPFIFAKTGSLSNNYNLTGYLKTEAGKTLIFSFMNNNFLSPIADIKAEAERILTLIHTRY